MKTTGAKRLRTEMVWTFLLGAALAGGGCAAARPRTAATFHITYDQQGCPTGAEVPAEERNCSCLFSTKPDCVKVSRGATVVFEKAPAKPVPGTKDAKPFEIFFDPFQAVALPRVDGQVRVKVASDAPYKAYPFNVVAPGCTAIDPIIIVTP